MGYTQTDRQTKYIYELKRKAFPEKGFRDKFLCNVYTAVKTRLALVYRLQKLEIRKCKYVASKQFLFRMKKENQRSPCKKMKYSHTELDRAEKGQNYATLLVTTL